MSVAGPKSWRCTRCRVADYNRSIEVWTEKLLTPTAASLEVQFHRGALYNKHLGTPEWLLSETKGSLKHASNQ